MASRKVFVQMGQSKATKHKALHKKDFGGHLAGKNPREIISLALRETRKAAEGGDVRALYLLGMAYIQGCGVRQDAVEGFAWLHKAAQAGLAEAQCHIAAMYYRGLGCQQSNEDAAQWWQQAAEQGDPAGLYYYGLALFRGDGVNQDQMQGFNLLRQAAKLKVAEAAQILRTQEMLQFAMRC